MLTDDQKKEILEEEIYRNEIQTELKEKKKKENKAWTFLNSSFGIWLLSSVALGLITWGYSQITTAVTENKKNKTDIAKHDAEIGGRIKNYRLQLSQIHNPLEYFNANNCFILGQCYQEGSILPEFKDKSVRALLLDMSIIVSSDRKPQIRKALLGLDSLNQTQILQGSNYDRYLLHDSLNAGLKSNAGQLLTILSKSFDIEYWK
jgi:hypothetical protein